MTSFEQTGLPAPMPSGYSLNVTPPPYSIETTAEFVGLIEVCFIVSAINDPDDFNRLRILQSGGAELVDRTILAPDSPAPHFASRTLCSRTNTLSQFVTAFGPTLAPPIEISGRVLTPAGIGIRNATVFLTDVQGNRLTATTTSFGLYTFSNVPPGRTYTLSVSSKRYRFASRQIAPNDNINNADFIGLE